MSGYTNDPLHFGDLAGQVNGTTAKNQATTEPQQQSGADEIPGTNYVRPWSMVPQQTRDANGNLVTTYVKQYTNSFVPKPTAKSGAGGGAGRNDALTAAQAALSGYLNASANASARQKDAFDAFKQLSGYALPAGSTTAPGYEPGGPAQAFAASIGLKNYQPPPIGTMQVNPSAIAAEPQLSPAVQQMLASIGAAGGNQAAQYAATGGQ